MELTQALSPGGRDMGVKHGLGQLWLLFGAFSIMNPFILTPAL